MTEYARKSNIKEAKQKTRTKEKKQHRTFQCRFPDSVIHAGIRPPRKLERGECRERGQSFMPMTRLLSLQQFSGVWMPLIGHIGLFGTAGEAMRAQLQNTCLGRLMQQSRSQFEPNLESKVFAWDTWYSILAISHI